MRAARALDALAAVGAVEPLAVGRAGLALGRGSERVRLQTWRAPDGKTTLSMTRKKMMEPWGQFQARCPDATMPRCHDATMPLSFLEAISGTMKMQ